MKHRYPRTSLLALATVLLALPGCGVEQAKPAPVVDADRWGHLPPDPERPQQAEHSEIAETARQG